MPPAKTRDARQSVIDFYAAFAKLVAHWVHFDLHTLSRFRPDETIMPDLASPQYMNVFASLVRKGEVYASGYQQDGSDQVDVGEILDVFYMHLGGSMVPVMRMIQLQLDLLMRFPPMLNNLAFYSSLVDMAVQESARCLQASVSLGYGEHVLEQPRRQMVNGYHVFRKISEALSTMIDKHPSNVVPDALPSLLLHLSDVYCVVLQSQHMVPADAWTVLASDQGIPVESTLETPEDILKSHRERHPDIPAANAAEVISTHWRFDVYSRLILTGQMQVRVQGVTSMCSDLVQFWKKYSGEHADEFRNPPVLDYFARYLLRNDLINYILGPTCHPEITAESSNIIGFLVVTRTYSTEQTDRFWETLTSSQDPRVGEALMRMLARIANLFHPEPLLYICQKLETLPIEGFTPSMRDFCDSITKTLFAARHQTGEAMGPLESAPYELCLRLIRESSVTRPASPIAYPEIQNFAINKLKELMNGVSPAVHREIYMSCIQDVSSCSETTLGSLWGIFLAARNFLARELQVLAAEHGITKLLVDELEHAIATSHANGCGAVLTGTANQPRRELLAGIIRHQPATLTADLSRRLWDLLVGQGAACQDDRKTSWISINSIWRLSKDNPFLTTCFHEYLPSLPREFFCNGALDFIREAISPQLNDTGSNILEVPEGDVDSIGIEQLWRIILTATDQPVVDSAIHTLVNEVYIESPLILSFPHARHRAVHLALVGRCLKQLDQAARKLKSYVDGATSGDEEMVIVPSDGQVRDQEMIFVRSLAVLREFLRAHQLKSHFASPDLRSLMSQSPNTIEGDPADLKYQSFDGTSQTEVRPLKIGRRNTAASLLASIREATGFDNYRLYYRGQAFTPSESDICRSLDDLQIQSGLLLVKREDEAVATSPKSKPGASPLEIEIMGHFKQLWEYLSMEGKLAREIYGFLVKLPVDDSILEAFEDEGKSHEDIFPDGQPFKSLYAIHALRESLASRRRSSVLQSASPVSPGTENQTHEDAYVKLLSRAISLIVSAITDARVVDDCPNVELKIQVAFFLADCLVHFLKGQSNLRGWEYLTAPMLTAGPDPRLPPSAGKCLDSALLERLLAFVGLSSESPGLTHSAQLAIRSFEAMLESCLVSHSFWCLFKGDERLPDLLGSILIDDERQPVRIGVGKFMIAKCAACQG